MNEPQWLIDARADGRILNETGVKLPEAAPVAEKKEQRPNKYGNQKTVVDGNVFDSKKEAERYQSLLVGEMVGKIRNLKFKKKDCRFPIKVNGELVCTYIADFVYEQYLMSAPDAIWISVVEDVKSDFTRKNPVYRIKNKLMRAVLGISIREV